MPQHAHQQLMRQVAAHGGAAPLLLLHCLVKGGGAAVVLLLLLLAGQGPWQDRRMMATLRKTVDKAAAVEHHAQILHATVGHCN
jgi:hypothetical protein